MPDDPDSPDRPSSDPSHSRPTPGPTAPTPSWPTYDRLEATLEAYLDHEPDDPTWSDVWRAVAAILGEYQRDVFIQAFDLAEPADTPCIQRLITGAETCPHGPTGDGLASASDAPPHSPPADDHATLWLDAGGEPALYGIHVYPGNIERLDAEEPPRNRWFDLFEFAAKWGLEVSVLAKSWYNLGSAVHVVFYPPERYRVATDK